LILLSNMGRRKSYQPTMNLRLKKKPPGFRGADGRRLTVGE
jgi:hypothetical protein